MTVTPTPPASTSLADFIEPFQREVALPGAFTTTYPDVSEDDTLAFLQDVFAECQLDGWFGTHTQDRLAATITPAITDAAGSLIVIYAGMRWVRTELRTLKTVSRYKAGPVEYEVQQGASVLLQLLKDLTARKDALLAIAQRSAGRDFVLDGYTGRDSAVQLGLFAPVELPAPLLGIAR